MVDFDAIRAEFPILDQSVHGHPLVYLDSAAHRAETPAASSMRKPISTVMTMPPCIVARMKLAARSTVAFERARASMARLVGACAG